MKRVAKVTEIIASVRPRLAVVSLQQLLTQNVIGLYLKLSILRKLLLLTIFKSNVETWSILVELGGKSY